MSKQILQGIVVSDVCDKTVTVRVEQRKKHDLYKKFIKKASKYTAHDENNQFKKGDFVSIEECRPLSKTKRWRVLTTNE